MRRRRVALLAALASALAVPAAPAQAADPGRWKETGLSSMPLEYYQGITNDPGGHLFFNGIYFGLYRTNRMLEEEARNDDVIPPGVHASENYNHIGDTTWDAAEGGRIILPLECYYPPAGNTCMNGAFGVADPQTLQWLYYVKLDPADIPKAMFAEVSPDGSLVWTSSGKDLLAYRTADINAQNAAPAGKLLRPVRRVKNAVPPSGITGAAFRDGRMYVAGQDQGPFQVWSIDLSDGSRRLEIERRIVGESEGIAFVNALGGTLQWMIEPYNEEGKPPTYGVDHATLLHFVPATAGTSGPGGSGGGAGGAPATTRARIRVRVTPRHVRRGARLRVTVRVTAGGHSLPGARVRVGGREARSDARGRARLLVHLRFARRYRVRASKPGLRAGEAWISVRRR